MSLSVPRRRWAFTALILATVVAVLDISAVNLALPSIATSLGLSIEQVLWLSKANLFTCATTILPCAALGDVMGHRRLLSMGLATFATTSACTALCSDLWLLVSLRAVQGVAGAAIMCSTLVLMREIFPAKMLGSALGTNALFVAVTTTAGPALCGLILAWLSWRWIFAVTPFMALIAWAMARFQLPEKRSREPRFDLLGTTLLIGSAVLLLSWHAYPVAGSLGLSGCVIAMLFLMHQRFASHPILPLRLFGNMRFAYALTASVIAFIGQSSAFIALPLVFQRDMGYSPLMAAALFLPWPLVTAIVGPWAGKVADQFSARIVASVGIAVFLSGLAALASLTPDGTPLNVAWRMALCGAGFGLFQSPNNREILTNVISDHATRAAALLCTARLLGQAMGAAWVSAPLAVISPPFFLKTTFDIAGLLWSNTVLQAGLLAMGALAWALSLCAGGRRAFIQTTHK